ncbi:MAG: hypothetical protein HFACDABA_02286 [Anaerolineales bacterium]|nr:hypothetical protein [Anaerolineales bacterium]
MKRMTRIFSALALLTLLLIPAGPAFALGANHDGGPVIFGGAYTLQSGETLNSDLVVFGGSVSIEADALVKGSIVIFGGNLTLDGSMEGDLVIFGGAGSLGPKSVVEGDLVTIGGSISRAEGSVVKGRIQNDPAIQITAPELPNLPQPGAPTPLVDVEGFNPVADALQTMVMALAMGGLAMLLSLFLQPQMERMTQVITSQPVVSGGAGLLTLVVAPFALLLMVVTVVLIPVAALALVLLAAAWVFGMIALGMEAGERFTRAINQTWAPVLTAGFGTFLLTLVIGGIGLVPCFGWMLEFVVALVAIGAAVLTVFGSRAYLPATPSPAAGPGNEPLPPTS